jgi:parvulin-like peptidyl-prolyl isomerase
MRPAVRRLYGLLMLSGILSACSAPGVSAPFSEPAAAIVDGQSIPMKAYQARLAVSRHRDPFAGIPEAVPSPAPSQRLEDFTIEQLVREEIIRQLASRRGITIADGAVSARIASLRSSAGASAFNAALSRNGFTNESFAAYERALLAEVALLHAMARDRVRSAAQELKNGQPFAGVVARWSDDQGTSTRGGDAGWLRPADIPEAPLATAVAGLDPGEVTPVVETSRGFTIASVLDRRNDQVHLAVLLVLAPSVELFSPQGTPPWFISAIDERESALRRDGKIAIKVGSHAGR